MHSKTIDKNIISRLHIRTIKQGIHLEKFIFQYIYQIDIKKHLIQPLKRPSWSQPADSPISSERR
ncbi:MAG: hypothetical protein D3924_03730 [Candidatus Electrothrix sp. AR4]|nr:hypothetical protein [Candidatus Electrothrix sp. AR4]